MLMNRKILRLNIIVFLYSLVANLAHPVTPTFIKMLGLHDYMFGLAFGMMSLANFLFSPFWGKMAERFGPARILTVTLLGYGAMQFFFGMSSKEWQICLARLCGGFFIGAVSVSEIVFILKNSEQSGKDLAVMTMINSVVSQFGFLIGGFIGTIGVRLTFIVQAVSLASIGGLVLLLLRDSETSTVNVTASDFNPFADFAERRDILSRYMILFLAIVSLSSLGATCYEQCFNYYLTDRFSFPSSYNGVIKAMIGFVSLLTNYFIAMKLIRRTNTDRTIVWVYAVLTLMLLGVILIGSLYPFLIVNILFFGVNSVVATILHDMIVKHEPEQAAKVAGLYNSVRMLGSVIGSFAAGFIYELSPKAAFVLSAAAMSACMIISYLHRKESDSRERGLSNEPQ